MGWCASLGGDQANLSSPLCNDRGASKIAEHHLEPIKGEVSNLPGGSQGIRATWNLPPGLRPVSLLLSLVTI